MTGEPAMPDGGPATRGTPTVVVVGAASRDHATDDPRGWRLGGGVCYGALTTARLGIATAALIGVDPPASTAAELDLLRAAGVDVRLVPIEHGPVFDNIETATGRIQLCFDRSDPVPPDALPAEWRSAPAWLFGPVAAELPGAWVEAVPSHALVATGWQGLLRDLVPGERVRHHPPGRSPIVDRADFVGVSRDDFDQNVSLAALCRLMKPGATLVLTQGPRGGIVMLADPAGPRALRRWPPIPPSMTVDPTGAGDVFLAALLAAHAEPRLIEGRYAQGYDLLLGAAASSLVLEGLGLLGVPGRADVRRRMARAQRHPEFVTDAEEGRQEQD